MSKPQGKSIVDYFKSTNGGQQISPSLSSRQQLQQQVSSISTTSSSKSSKGNITVLNTSGGQEIASARSVPQVSGSDGISSGVSPTRDFYNNSYSLGV
jgi:hypothetical protein